MGEKRDGERETEDYKKHSRTANTMYRKNPSVCSGSAEKWERGGATIKTGLAS